MMTSTDMGSMNIVNSVGGLNENAMNNKSGE